ncbi:hypothetical protein D3C73_959080 [compost metagenome]
MKVTEVAPTPADTDDLTLRLMDWKVLSMFALAGLKDSVITVCAVANAVKISARSPMKKTVSADAQAEIV